MRTSRGIVPIQSSRVLTVINAHGVEYHVVVMVRKHRKVK